MSSFHTPVLLREVIEGLGVKEGGKYIDTTLGGGGHGIEIVKRGGRLLGIDADPDAIAFASEKLSVYKDWNAVQGNFRNIETIAKENDFDTVDGILFDLGVSSHQLDAGVKGFSYRFKEAPLDLRYDPSEDLSAADIVNTAPEEELYEIFARFGEEQLARPVAHALVVSRRMKPFVTTGDLVDIVSHLVRDKSKLSATLSRIFQAIRIVVNDEIAALIEGLEGAERLLKPGDKVAVISFHSLEDRIVKKCMHSSSWRATTKHPIIASSEEIARNQRARSAKLRIAVRI